MHSDSSSRPKAPLWLLVLVTLAGTLAMHMFIPALPDATRDLASSSGHMQQTITVYILGLALGQLVYGPLSDSLGRRPMLLIGLGLYTAASLAALFSPTDSWLITTRLFQALGGCAGLALGRAIARDTSTPETVVANLALLNLMMMLGPGIAPFIGSTIDALLGWRAIFALLTLMGLFTLISVWRLLPETGHPTGQFNWRTVQRDYRHLLGTPQFVILAIGGGCATTGMYAFIAAAPFIFMEQLHTSKAQVGLYLGMVMAGMAVGNLLTRQLIRRWPVERLMMGGNLLSLICASLLLLLILLNQLSIPAVVTLMGLFSLGAGLTSPAALSKALDIHPELTGSAAGVYGCTQMLVGALCTLAASLGSNPALSATCVLLIASAIGQLGFRAALKYQTPRPDGS